MKEVLVCGWVGVWVGEPEGAACVVRPLKGGSWSVSTLARLRLQYGKRGEVAWRDRK